MTDFIPTITDQLTEQLACLSQAEHDYAASKCSAEKPAQVKGFGALALVPRSTASTSTMMVSARKALIDQNPCVAASLPVCPGATPSTPTPTPGPGDQPADEPSHLKQKGLLVGGLLALVVVGGGYVVYRQTKKRKGRRR